MSYEVRDNLLYQWLEGEFRPVDDAAVAVADALDVLRAAGWDVWTESDGNGKTYTVARSPRREVD